MDCFVTFPYTHMMVSKNNIKKRDDKQVMEPPQSPHWFSPELTITQMLGLHVSQEHVIPIQSLHHQSISNSRIYTGRQECRWIRGKYVHSVELGTNGSNRGAKHRPPRATIVVSPPKIDEPDVTFRDKLLCYNRSYPQVHSPTLSLSITVVIES